MSSESRPESLLLSSDALGGITPSGSAFQIEFDTVGGKSFRTGEAPAFYATAKVCQGGYLVATAYPDLGKCVVEPVRALKYFQNSSTHVSKFTMGSSSGRSNSIESGGGGITSSVPPPPGFSFSSEVSAAGFQVFRSSFKAVEFIIPSSEEGSITSIQLLVDGAPSSSSHSSSKPPKMGPNLFNASPPPLPYVHLLVGTSTGVLVVCDVMRGRILAIASLVSGNGSLASGGKPGRKGGGMSPALTSMPLPAASSFMGISPPLPVGNSEDVEQTENKNGKSTISARLLRSSSFGGDVIQGHVPQRSSSREGGNHSLLSSSHDTRGGCGVIQKEQVEEKERSFRTPPDIRETKSRRRMKTSPPSHSASHTVSGTESPEALSAFSMLEQEKGGEEKPPFRRTPAGEGGGVAIPMLPASQPPTSPSTLRSPTREETKSPYPHSDASKEHLMDEDAREAVGSAMQKLFHATNQSFTPSEEAQRQNKKEEMEKNNAMSPHGTSGSLPIALFPPSVTPKNEGVVSTSTTPEMAFPKEFPPVPSPVFSEEEDGGIVAFVPWGYAVEKDMGREHWNVLACQGVWIVHRGGQMECVKREALDLFIQVAETEANKGRRFAALRPSLKKWEMADTNTVLPAVGPAAAFISLVDVVYHAEDIPGTTGTPSWTAAALSASTAGAPGMLMDLAGRGGFTVTPAGTTASTSTPSSATPTGSSHAVQGGGNALSIPSSASSVYLSSSFSSTPSPLVHRKVFHDAAFFSLAIPSAPDAGIIGGEYGNAISRKGQPVNGLSCLLLCGTSPSFCVYPLHPRDVNWKDGVKGMVTAASRFFSRFIGSSIHPPRPTAPELVKLTMQRFFFDPQVTFTKVQIDPTQEWAVLHAGDMGKIFLIHLASGITRRTWASSNPHRPIQFQWFTRKIRQQLRVFLAVHFPSASFSSPCLSQEKGALEVYEMQELQCVGRLSIAEEAVLLPSPLLSTGTVLGSDSTLSRAPERHGGARGSLTTSLPSTAVGSGAGSGGVVSGHEGSDGAGGGSVRGGTGEEVMWLEPSTGAIYRLALDPGLFAMQEKEVEKRTLREVEQMIQQEWNTTLETMSMTPSHRSTQMGGKVAVRVPGCQVSSEQEKTLWTGDAEAARPPSGSEGSSLFLSSSCSTVAGAVSVSSPFMRNTAAPPSPRENLLRNPHAGMQRCRSFHVDHGATPAGDGGHHVCRVVIPSPPPCLMDHEVLAEILMTCQRPIDFYDCAANLPLPSYRPPRRVRQGSGTRPHERGAEDSLDVAHHVASLQRPPPPPPTSSASASPSEKETHATTAVPSATEMEVGREGWYAACCWPLQFIDECLEYVQLMQQIRQWLVWQFAPGASASRLLPLKKSYLLGDTPASAQVPDNLTAGQALNYLWHQTELVSAYRALVIPAPVEYQFRYIAGQGDGREEGRALPLPGNSVPLALPGHVRREGGLPPIVFTSTIVHPLLHAFGLPPFLYDVTVRKVDPPSCIGMEGNVEATESSSMVSNQERSDGRSPMRTPSGECNAVQQFWQRCFHRVQRELSRTASFSPTHKEEGEDQGLYGASHSSIFKRSHSSLPVAQDDGDVLVQRLLPHLFFQVLEEKVSLAASAHRTRAEEGSPAPPQTGAPLSPATITRSHPTSPTPAPLPTASPSSLFSYSVISLSSFQKYFFCGQESILFLRDRIYQEERDLERGAGHENRHTGVHSTGRPGSRGPWSAGILPAAHHKWARLGEVVFGQYGLGVFPFQIAPLRKLGFSMDDVAVLTVAWVTERCARVGTHTFLASIPLGAFVSTFLLVSGTSLLKAIEASPLAIVSDSREELKQTCWRVEALLMICVVRCLALCRQGKRHSNGRMMAGHPVRTGSRRAGYDMLGFHRLIQETRELHSLDDEDTSMTADMESFQPLPSTLKEYITEVASTMTSTAMHRGSYFAGGSRVTTHPGDGRSGKGEEGVGTATPIPVIRTDEGREEGSHRSPHKGEERAALQHPPQRVDTAPEGRGEGYRTTSRSVSMSTSTLRQTKKKKKQKKHVEPHPFLICLHRCIRLWMVLTDETETLLITSEKLENIVQKTRKREKSDRSTSPQSRPAHDPPHRLLPFRLSMLFTSSMLGDVQSPLSTTIEEYVLEATGMDFSRIHRLHAYFAGKKQKQKGEREGEEAEAEESGSPSTSGHHLREVHGIASTASREERPCLRSMKEKEKQEAPPSQEALAGHGVRTCSPSSDEDVLNYWELAELLYLCGVPNICTTTQCFHDMQEQYFRHTEEKEIVKRIRETSEKKEKAHRHSLQGKTHFLTPHGSHRTSESRMGEGGSHSHGPPRSPSPSLESPSFSSFSPTNARYSPGTSREGHANCPAPLPYTSSYLPASPWPWMKAEGQWNREAFDEQVRRPLWRMWENLVHKTPAMEKGKGRPDSSDPLSPGAVSSSSPPVSFPEPGRVSPNPRSSRVANREVERMASSPSRVVEEEVKKSVQEKAVARSPTLASLPLPPSSFSPSSTPPLSPSAASHTAYEEEDPSLDEANRMFARCVVFTGFLSVVEELLRPLVCRLGIFWDTSTIPRLDFLSVPPTLPPRWGGGGSSSTFASHPHPLSTTGGVAHEDPQHSVTTTASGTTITSPSEEAASPLQPFSSTASMPRRTSPETSPKRAISPPPPLTSVERDAAVVEAEPAMSSFSASWASPFLHAGHHHLSVCLSGTRAVDAYLTSLMDMLECVHSMHHTLDLDSYRTPLQLIQILVTSIFRDDQQVFRSIPTGIRDRLFPFISMLESSPKRIQVITEQYMRLLHLVQYFMRSSQLQVEGIPVHFFSVHMPWKALIGPLEALHFLPSREASQGGLSSGLHAIPSKKESRSHKGNRSELLARENSPHRSSSHSSEARNLAAVFKAAGWTPMSHTHVGGWESGGGSEGATTQDGVSYETTLGVQRMMGREEDYLKAEKERWNLITETLRQFVMDGILLPVMDKLTPAAANLLFHRHSHGGGVVGQGSRSSETTSRKSSVSSSSSTHMRPLLRQQGPSLQPYFGTSKQSSSHSSYSSSLPSVMGDKKGHYSLSHTLQIPAFDAMVLRRLQSPETYLIIVQFAAVLGLNENLAALIILDFHLKFLSDISYIGQQIHLEKNNTAIPHLIRFHLQKMLYVVYDFVEKCDSNANIPQGPRRTALLEARKKLDVSQSFKDWLKLPVPEMDPTHPLRRHPRGDAHAHDGPFHSVQWHPTADKERNETVAAYTARRARQLKVLEESVNWFTPVELSVYSTLLHTIINSHAPDTIDRLKNTLLHLKDAAFTLLPSPQQGKSSAMGEYNIIETFGGDILSLIELIVSAI